jgi:hypothetical protein
MTDKRTPEKVDDIRRARTKNKTWKKYDGQDPKKKRG